MLLSAISDAASTALVEAGTSLLSSLAGEAGITVGEGLLGVEAGAIAGPIGIVAGTVATALLQFIPTANEHSVMSNFGDHGLND